MKRPSNNWIFHALLIVSFAIGLAVGLCALTWSTP
jgi:hypothetical protein